MKKSSLGRRNSNRPSSAVADASTVRKSGIPLAKSRALSTDRQSTGNFSKINRAGSTSNLSDFGSVAKTPLSSRFQGSGTTERPSRATSFGTPSVSIGTSSYGLQNSKRDTRPLQDKEWQANATAFIEGVVSQIPNGLDVLGSGLFPLTLTKFLDVCNFLLKNLDPSVEINKHNYLKELPFLLGKRMKYKGKMDKSWMIAASTPRNIPHVLGLLQFLAVCVNVLINVNIEELMFPPKFDNNPAPQMNFQLLIPYYNHSFEIKKLNSPDYATMQEELDRHVMQQHYLIEDTEVKKEALLEEAQKLQYENENKLHERDLILNKLKAHENRHKNILASLKSKEDALVKCKIAVSTFNDQMVDRERNLISAQNDLEALKEELNALTKNASEQVLVHRDIVNITKKRDSIDRAIASCEKYIKSYQDMIYTEDIEILKIKVEIDELTRNSNLKVMKYVPHEQDFEQLILPTDTNELSTPLVQMDALHRLKLKWETNSRDLKKKIETEENYKNQLKKELETLLEKKTTLLEDGGLHVELNALSGDLEKETDWLSAEWQAQCADQKKMKNQLADQKIAAANKSALAKEAKKEEQRAKELVENFVKVSLDKVKCVMDKSNAMVSAALGNA